MFGSPVGYLIAKWSGNVHSFVTVSVGNATWTLVLFETDSDFSQQEKQAKDTLAITKQFLAILNEIVRTFSFIRQP